MHCAKSLIRLTSTSPRRWKSPSGCVPGGRISPTSHIPSSTRPRTHDCPRGSSWPTMDCEFLCEKMTYDEIRMTGRRGRKVEKVKGGAPFRPLRLFDPFDSSFGFHSGFVIHHCAAMDHSSAMLAFVKLAGVSQARQQLGPRDKFLVLAGVAASRAGHAAVAQRCRELLLAHNPSHLLKRYGTIEQALEAEEFTTYLRQTARF